MLRSRLRAPLSGPQPCTSLRVSTINNQQWVLESADKCPPPPSSCPWLGLKSLCIFLANTCVPRDSLPQNDIPNISARQGPICQSFLFYVPRTVLSPPNLHSIAAVVAHPIQHCFLVKLGDGRVCVWSFSKTSHILHALGNLEIVLVLYGYIKNYPQSIVDNTIINISYPYNICGVGGSGFP